MDSTINPITFFGSETIIHHQIGQTNSTNKEDVKQAFLKLLLDKIYLNGFNSTSPMDNDERDDEDLSVFNKDVSNSYVNEMFRQQISDQMVASDVFSLNDLGINK